MWKLSYPQNHNGATPCLPSPKVGNAHFKTSFVVPGAAEGLHYGPSSVIGAKGRRCSCNCYIKKKRKIVQYDSHFSRTPLVISPLVAIRLSGLSTWFIGAHLVKVGTEWSYHTKAFTRESHSSPIQICFSDGASLFTRFSFPRSFCWFSPDFLPVRCSTSGHVAKYWQDSSI